MTDMDELHRTLDALQASLQDAKAMPLSASCMVNRGELLALVARARALLPAALAAAQQVLGDRSGVMADGRREADQVIAAAHQERQRLLADTDIARSAQGEAERILARARDDGAKLRRDVDDYVDGKLATFEIVLSKTLAAVERGRQKLSGRTDLDALGDISTQPPLPH